MKNVCLYQTLRVYLFLFYLNMFLPFLKDNWSLYFHILNMEGHVDHFCPE